MYTPLKNISPKLQITLKGNYYENMRVGFKRIIKRFLTILLAVNVGLIATPSTSQSVEIGKSELIEWSRGFNTLSFGLTGDHTDIQKYLPWYRYDPVNSPFISSQVPLSIRVPVAILLDFSKNDCINIPVKIRREVPMAIATDSLNALSIDFYPFQSPIVSKTKAFESKPEISFGPSNWANNSEVSEIQLPACKDTLVIPGKTSLGSSLSVNFVWKYSRDLASLKGETSKCKEIISDKCVISQRSIMSIELLSNSSRNIELPMIYETSIKEIQDFLDTNPCFPNGVGDRLLSPITCANASKNVEILKSELLAIKPLVVQKPQTKLNTKKSMEITCAKGKTFRKVTGIAPKCPKGYVKK